MTCSHISQRDFSVQRDGLTIRGIEFRPQGETLPIAIVCHGFMGNDTATMHYARQIAAWGYAAYCFDFIGGGVPSKSDGSLAEMTVLTEKQDLLAVIAYVCALPYTDRTRLTLMGCSQGGFVCALAAAALQARVQNLILLFPALCIPDDARKGQMMEFPFDPQNIPDAISAGPLTLGGGYARAVIHMDPYREIAGYAGNVLILHGLADTIVSPAYSEKARQVYGEKCVLRFLPGAGHGFLPQEDAYALRAIRQFLDGQPVLPMDDDGGGQHG